MRKSLPRPSILKYTRPPLYAKQEEAIFAPERYSIIEASTKVGKTVGCLTWIYEKSLALREGQSCWWVAPTYSQAKIAFRRLKQFIPAGHCTTNEAEMIITTLVGSTIYFKSGDNPNALYGEDVFAAVIDEATRVKEDAWIAVRSTLTATKGHIRIIGNVHGTRNWAYRLARQAQNGEPNMAYFKLTAYDAVDAGVLEKAEIEDARSKLPEEVFNQLYMARAADDQGNPFGLDAINRCVIKELAPGPVVAWGWDIARKIDFTVGIGLNEEGDVCEFHRVQWDFERTFLLISDRTGNGRAPGLVDATGVGAPLVERLRRSGFYHIAGFLFSMQSKQQLLEALAMAIHGVKIRYPEGRIVEELEAFEYTLVRKGVMYSTPPGMHDDCVAALALAVKQWNELIGYGRRAARFTYRPFI